MIIWNQQLDMSLLKFRVRIKDVPYLVCQALRLMKLFSLAVQIIQSLKFIKSYKSDWFFDE